MNWNLFFLVAICFGYFLSLSRIVLWYIVFIKNKVSIKYNSFDSCSFRVALIIALFWPVQYFSLLYLRKGNKPLSSINGLPVIPFALTPNQIRVNINHALIKRLRDYKDANNKTRSVSLKSFLLKQILVGFFTAPFNGILWVVGVTSVFTRAMYRYILQPDSDETYG